MGLLSTCISAFAFDLVPNNGVAPSQYGSTIRRDILQPKGTLMMLGDRFMLIDLWFIWSCSAVWYKGKPPEVEKALQN